MNLQNESNVERVLLCAPWWPLKWVILKFTIGSIQVKAYGLTRNYENSRNFFVKLKEIKFQNKSLIEVLR